MKEKDLRYIKTELSLRQALFSLLDEKEFDRITIKDITDRAEVNRNTFYLHYKDKFALINSVLISFIEELSLQSLEAIEDYDIPSKAALDKYFVTIFVNTNKVKAHYRLIFRNRNIEPYLDVAAVTDVIKEHIESNKFLKQITSPIAQNFLAFGFFGAINEYCTNDYSSEETSMLISKMSMILSTIVDGTKLIK